MIYKKASNIIQSVVGRTGGPRGGADAGAISNRSQGGDRWAQMEELGVSSDAFGGGSMPHLPAIRGAPRLASTNALSDALASKEWSILSPSSPVQRALSPGGVSGGGRRETPLIQSLVQQARSQGAGYDHTLGKSRRLGGMPSDPVTISTNSLSIGKRQRPGLGGDNARYDKWLKDKSGMHEGPREGPSKGLFDFNETAAKGSMMGTGMDAGGLGAAFAGAAIGGAASYMTGGEFGTGAGVGAIGAFGVRGLHRHVAANSKFFSQSIAGAAKQEGWRGKMAQRVMSSQVGINRVQQRHAMMAGAGLFGVVGGGERNRNNHRRGFNAHRGNAF